MLKLVVGNKAYSSWSMRPWILMEGLGIPFEEIVVPLYRAESKSALLRQGPSGKAPVLHDGDLIVWDSLAIVEYLAEKFPDIGIWPIGAQARSRARSLCAEMHAGFQALRQQSPTNFRRDRRASPKPIDTAAQADLEQIEAAWANARCEFGGGGPFLFGAFCAADAFFAPVVARLDTYALPVSAVTNAYMRTVMAMPAWFKWRAGAKNETWVIEKWENL